MRVAGGGGSGGTSGVAGGGWGSGSTSGLARPEAMAVPQCGGVGGSRQQGGMSEYVDSFHIIGQALHRRGY